MKARDVIYCILVALGAYCVVLVGEAQGGELGSAPRIAAPDRGGWEAPAYADAAGVVERAKPAAIRGNTALGAAGVPVVMPQASPSHRAIWNMFNQNGTLPELFRTSSVYVDPDAWHWGAGIDLFWWLRK